MELSEYLKSVKSRADGATEGPWESTQPYSNQYEIVKRSSDFAPKVLCSVYHAPGVSEFRYNNYFIAHSRTDIPALVAMVDKIMELLEPEVIEFIEDDISKLIPGGEK